MIGISESYFDKEQQYQAFSQEWSEFLLSGLDLTQCL